MRRKREMEEEKENKIGEKKELRDEKAIMKTHYFFGALGFTELKTTFVNKTEWF
jgi:hypothetical protein